MKLITQSQLKALAVTAFAFSCTALTPLTAQTLVKTQKVGDNIYQPVVNQKDGAVFISSAGNNRVYKLDPQTLLAVDSIETSESAPMGLGISNNTQTLYTTNSRSGLVVAID